MRKCWVAICGLWAVGVIVGFNVQWAYCSKPGPVVTAPAVWPFVFATGFAQQPRRPTLVMFAHPRCPCTRASMQELDKLVAQAPGKIDVQVLFYKPSMEPPSWAETDLLRSARRIPGARVFVDEDNMIAQQFAIATSGQVFLFGRDGDLLFSGGITAGRSAILSLLRGEAHNRLATPVFGCPLCESVPGLRN
ncbi:MAG: hypothetical protein ABL888_10245 [Pirellulaceae bacterium]